jgi:hypothetical protein
MIYGAIGYSILGKSPIFKNVEIILLSDQHDEPTPSCMSDDGKIVPSILVSDYLKKLIYDNYIILLEEIPYDGELIGLWEDSIHVTTTRDFYLSCKRHHIFKDKIIPVDIRLEIINNLDKKYSDEQIFGKYIYKISEFCIFKLDFLQKLSLYNNNIDKSILGKCYNEILNKFRFFTKSYEKHLNSKIKDIHHKREIYDTIEILLSDILEFFCILSIYDMILKNQTKFAIYCGLYHIEKIQNILLKYFKFDLLKTHGTMSMTNISNDGICTHIPKF